MCCLPLRAWKNTLAALVSRPGDTRSTDRGVARRIHCSCCSLTKTLVDPISENYVLETTNKHTKKKEVIIIWSKNGITLHGATMRKCLLNEDSWKEEKEDAHLMQTWRGRDG